MESKAKSWSNYLDDSWKSFLWADFVSETIVTTVDEDIYYQQTLHLAI